jgi:hypothetical protein
MPDPPDPLLPAALLALVARLGFLAFSTAPDGTAIGTFQGDNGAPLFLVAVGGGTCGTVTWALLPSPIPRGYAGHLVTRATYDVMHAGALAPDGCCVVYQGAAYRVRSLWNDPGHEARAVPA